MKILVFGGAGLLGRAITHEMRLRGHQVVTAGRRNCEVTLDLADEARVPVLAALLRGVDVAVNATGILIERDNDRFTALHVEAARAIAQACDAARVARLVHVSALGVANADINMHRVANADSNLLSSAPHIASDYLRSKAAGERAVANALQGSRTDVAIVRPSLLADDASPSTRLFSWLGIWHLVALPGVLRPGSARLAPIHARDVAECIARICEHEKALKNRNAGVIELAGPEIMSYREMMSRYRQHAGGKFTLWLPVPWWLMLLVARLAELIPSNRMFSSDTVRMLRASIGTDHNQVMLWLRRMPRALLTPTEPAPHALTHSVAQHPRATPKAAP
jgi:uncharacterized protein YbjT (DUF2867 family)